MKARKRTPSRPARAPRKLVLTVNRPQFLAGGTDLGFRQMIHDALAFSSRLVAVRDGYARLIGLTGPQYTILTSIHHLEATRDVSVTAVARHLHLSGTFVTSETGKLARRGLIEKQRDPADGRRLVLRVTQEGHARLARLAEIQREVNDEHFAPLARNGGFKSFSRLVGELVGSTDRALALLAARGPRIAVPHSAAVRKQGDRS